MVWPLAWRWRASRSVKNACRVGARVLTSHLPGVPLAAGRPAPSARVRRTGTGYSDVGISGITPIPGLFRYPFPCTRDGPVTWDDALSRLSPVGIIRCVSCAHEVSFLAFSAHVIVPPCSSERRAGSPNERGRCHGVEGVRAG